LRKIVAELKASWPRFLTAKSHFFQALGIAAANRSHIISENAQFVRCAI
jgi:hypothetical protein